MIHQQNVFERWPIEDESVQSIITSPPYYALRKYAIPDIIIGDKDCKHVFGSESIERKRGNVSGLNAQVGVQKSGICGTHVNHGSFCIHCQSWKGQYGLEPTPYGDINSYVEHTRLWAKEAWRVLRNDGIFFLNLADSYPSGGGKAVEQSARRQSAIDTGAYPDYSPLAKLRQSMPKCQLLIPHRVAIGLVDDGWVLRNTIVWFKSNSMPESVTDRFSKKYEYIFMFTKQEKYYFNLDAVREPHTQAIKDGVDKKEMESVWKAQRESKGKVQLDNSGKTNQGGTVNRNPLYYGNINGKNPGDIFSFPPEFQPEILNREEAAYIAALIDGEGSIILQGKKTNDCLTICIVNTHKGVLEWLCNTWGKGRLYNRKRDEKWRETWEFNLHSSSAEKLLKAIYPWLIIKKEQAKTALEFQSLGTTVGGTIDIENKARRKLLIEINSKLNHGELTKSDSPEPFIINNSSDVWSIPTQPSSEKHYAMWPERIVERMIKCSTKAGDTVLDPFCGSGSTLKVAEELQRVGIGIDLGYHEISKRRTANVQKKMFV